MREPATVHLGADVFAPAGTRRVARRWRHGRAPGDGASSCSAARRGAARRASRPAVDAARGRRRATSGRRRSPSAVGGPARRTCTCSCAAPARALPGLAPPLAGRRLAGALPRPLAAARPRRAAPPRTPRGRAGRAPRRRARRACRSTTTTQPPRDRARLAAPPRTTPTAASYLDMVNNVAVLGHAHPRLAAAVAPAVAAAQHQLALPLRRDRRSFASGSPRSRPTPLDTVFLVNSGSEADRPRAAARLGRHRPARRASRCESAYHGWTTATDAISTSIGRQPAGARDPARLGAHRRARRTPTAARTAAPTPHRYVADARAPCSPTLDDGRHGLARRSSCEPVYGNAGGVLAARRLPRSGVYAAVRAAGGALHRRRGAGRLRPARATTSGASSSRASCPTSSRSPRRWATATRSAR